MVALTGAKYLDGASGNEGIFSNEEKWIKCTYSFASDTGAQADLDVLVNGSDSKKYAITDFYAYARGAVTSSGTTNLDLGIGAGGTEFWSNKLKETLGLDSLNGMDTAKPVLLPASGKVILGIEATDVTAGILDFYFKVKQIL
jgi:hypothetical protein